jgi:hypothetical protein
MSVCESQVQTLLCHRVLALMQILIEFSKPSIWCNSTRVLRRCWGKRHTVRMCTVEKYAKRSHYMTKLVIVLGNSLPPPGSTAQLRPWLPPQSSSVIRLNFLEASQQFYFYKVGFLAPRPTPTLEVQASVFISPSDRVAQLYPRVPILVAC